MYVESCHIYINNLSYNSANRFQHGTCILDTKIFYVCQKFMILKNRHTEITRMEDCLHCGIPKHLLRKQKETCIYQIPLKKRGRLRQKS